MRFVGGKSFVQQGQMQAADGALYPLWVDRVRSSMTPLRVAFGSPDYFVLAADERVAQWLSISPALVLVIDGQAVQIVLDGDGESAPVATPDPVG